MGYKDSLLYWMIENRLDKGRDIKIIITARNSQTGLGKTTLGVILAKIHDRNGFNINKAFQRYKPYCRKYLNSKSGDVLLLDDFQMSGDSRRGTSHSNVQLSQIWQKFRFKNVITITTLPTTYTLDNRFLVLADVRINIERRGVFHPYLIFVHDFDHYVREFKFPDGPYSFDKIDHLDLFQKIEESKQESGEKRLNEWFD